MRTAERSALRSVVSAILIISSVIIGDARFRHPAYAQSAAKTVSYNIPAGSLGMALTRWAQTSGVKLLAPSGVLSGRTTQGLSGTYEPYQALDALLSNSGLTHSTSGNTVTVTDPNASGSNAGATIDGAIALDTIDVSGASAKEAAADEPYQTPGSSAYISSETLDLVPAITASDMFKNTPGVLGNSSHNGPQMDLNIRGMQGMNRVKVMVEGTQQDSSLHRGYNGPDNRAYVDQDLISGITIEKGPGTGPYGSGTTGGVVNMKTLSPDDILLDGKTYGVRLRGGVIGGTADPSPVGTTASAVRERPGWFDLDSAAGSASAAFAYRDDNYEFVAAAVRRRHGNYFAGKNGNPTYLLYQNPAYNLPPAPTPYSLIKPGAEVLNSAEDTTSTLLKAKFKFDGGQSIEIGHIGYESTYGYVYPLDTAPPGRRFVQEPPSTTKSDRAYARYRWNPADNDLIDFSANAWLTDGTEFTNGYSRLPASSDISAYGFEAWNNSRLDTAIGHFLVTYGAEHSQSEIDQYPGNATYAFGGERKVSGAYVNAKWTPIDFVTLNGGIRYDRYETAGPSRVCDAFNVCTYLDSGNSGSGVSPSAGVTLEPIKGLQFFTQYTEGYRPPSIRESIGTTQSGIVPNPALDAERSRNWEFGANLLQRDLVVDGDKALFKVAYFDSLYDDYIAVEYVNPLTAPQPQFQNVLTAKITGWEISGSYDAGVLFASGNVTIYDEVEYCAPGAATVACNSFLGAITNYEGVPPEYSGSVTIGTRLFDEKLVLGGRAFFFGERATGTLQPNGQTLFNFVHWRPDTIFDAFASYQINDNMELSSSIENVFDRYYLEPLIQARTPSPGRTMRANMTLKY